MDHKEGAKLQQTEGEIWVKGKALGKREPGEQEHRIVLGMACTGRRGMPILEAMDDLFSYKGF